MVLLCCTADEILLMFLLLLAGHSVGLPGGVHVHWRGLAAAWVHGALPEPLSHYRVYLR